MFDVHVCVCVNQLFITVGPYYLYPTCTVPLNVSEVNKWALFVYEYVHKLCQKNIPVIHLLVLVNILFSRKSCYCTCVLALRYPLQNIANNLWKCTFQLEQSMSVHALYGRGGEQVSLN